MAKQIGEQLTELNSGDTVAVTIDGDRYEGDVTDTKRWKCELVAGFMESGDLRIYLRLSTETVTRYAAPTEHLLITATEDVPRDWDTPQASFYRPAEEESTTQIGEIDDVSVVDNTSD